MRLALSIAIASVISACGGGSGGVGSTCSARADCATGLECSGPNDPPVCGIAPLETCSTDADCGGARCHAVFDGCSPDGVGAQCGPICQSDPECGSGFRCDTGSCVAVLCDAGFACEDREVCDPTRIAANTPIYDRHHGCFAVTCTTDAECDGRFCVNGTCQDSAGACAEPMLVP